MDTCLGEVSQAGPWGGPEVDPGHAGENYVYPLPRKHLGIRLEKLEEEQRKKAKEQNRFGMMMMMMIFGDWFLDFFLIQLVTRDVEALL